MFTGIIEQKAQVLENQRQLDGNRLLIQSSFEQLQAGESIAVNGVCLTLLSETEPYLSFDVSTETLLKTNLGMLNEGCDVNLERAMPANGRFGGHYVSGHVDRTLAVFEVNQKGDFLVLSLSGFSASERNFLLPKGSITVNGVSLTINEVRKDCIELMLIPHTLAMTNLVTLKPGDLVNIEFDYLTRIVAHQLKQSGQLMSEVDL